MRRNLNTRWLPWVLGLLLCAPGMGSTAIRPPRELIASYADATGKLQLYRMNEDGSAQRRITDSARDCSMPAWSPDGKKIVYVRESSGGTEIWLSSPDGQNPVMLVDSGTNMIPSWFPDSKRIVWMVLRKQGGRLMIMDTESRQSRPLFGDREQEKFSNMMPAISPDGTRVAFVSNRSGHYRIWLSALDGSGARLVSPMSREFDEKLGLPIEQKVPIWSPDGQWIAHWEGVEMAHMSPFWWPNPQRDALIEASWDAWSVGYDGKNKRKAGHGDDPTWSPDGFMTRSFPDKSKGGPRIMIQSKDGWRDLPILPARTPRYGRFTWKPLGAGNP